MIKHSNRRNILTRKSDQAVFFDFDGIMFRKSVRWKIINPAIGVSGSLVGCEKGYELYQKYKTKHPESQFEENFIIEDYVPNHMQADGSVDITPMETLIKTAENHRFRGRDLFIISGWDFKRLDFITNRIFEKFRQFEKQINPFLDCAMVSTHAETVSNCFTSKVHFLMKNMQLRTEEDANESCTDGYSKAFYYHTDMDMIDLFQNLITNEKANLCGGRNALIPSYISKLDALIPD